MPWYQVNGSVSFSGWCDVEADSPEEAADEAKQLNHRNGWEWDEGTFEVDVYDQPEVLR